MKFNKKTKFPWKLQGMELINYRQGLQEHTGERFIQLEYTAIQKYGLKKAGIITLFMHKAIEQTFVNPENGGWFYFLNSAIQKLCPDVTEKWLNRVRKEMKEEGILITARVGLTPAPWNFIDKEKYKQLLNEFKMQLELDEMEKGLDGIDKDGESIRIDDNPTPVKSRRVVFDPQSRVVFDPANNYRKANDILSTNVLCGTLGVPPNLLSTDSLDIISYWNTLPNVTKHKLDPSSKTIQSACKMLSALLQGIPMVNTKGNQPRKEMRTFFQSYKIDQVYLRKKWSVQEIKDHLLSAVTIKNGQMNTKISLPILLWNEFASKDPNGNKTAFSWFFYALALDHTPKAFIDMATSLAKAVNGKNHPILKWANELYRFSLAEEITPPPMAALLRWYLLNKDQSFMPMVRDMNEFIRKYRQIEDNRSHRRKNGGRSRLHVDEPVEFYDCKGNLIPSEQSGKINVDELEFYDGKGNLIPKDSAR